MTDAEMYAKYVATLKRASLLMGSMAAVERALGVGRNTVPHRVRNPSAVRREHLLALEALLSRIERGE